MAKTFLDKINAIAAIAAEAGFNLGVGVAPTSPSNGDAWNTAAAFFVRTNGVTRALALGRISDTFTLSTGQITATLTQTPASLADIVPTMGPINLDPAQITAVAAKVVTFNAIPASLNNKVLTLTYTRID